MKDVARLAGVSPTTVSHIINKSRFVSEETRHRVLEAMRELNYQPNAIARSLRRKATHTIGLVISDISNPFFTGLVRGSEDVANKHGYSIILCNTDEDPEKERMYVAVLHQKQIDGLIIAPAAGDHGYLCKLIEDGYPVVFVDRYLEAVPADAVVVDNECAAYEAVMHLIRLGHRRIGMIGGVPGISSTTERASGYERALRESGIPVDRALIIEGNSRVNGGYNGLTALLSGPQPPTAVFVVNNLMTIGAMLAIRDKGLRCPEDIAVVGFDDFEWASAFRPYLTVVAQPVYKLGETATQVLIDRIRGRRRRPQKTVLPAKLVVRESCGAAPYAAVRRHRE